MTDKEKLEVALKFLKQLTIDVEFISNCLTEQAYNPINYGCPIKVPDCTNCIFYIESLTGCCYHNLKEIKNFLSSCEE